MILPKTAAKVFKPVGKALIFIKKHSPKILLGLGIVGYGGSVYFASKAGEKAKKAQETYIRDHDKKKFIKGYVKAWGPSMGLFAVSTASVVGGHCILHGRYIATGVALEATRRAFKQYRDRVVAKEGEEADICYRNGFEKKAELEGEEVKFETVQTNKVDPKDYYIHVVDERNLHWDHSFPDGDRRSMFIKLKNIKSELNTMLECSIDDRMTFKEVLVRTGFKYALKDEKLARFAGRVGWKWGGEGDNYISFGPMFEKIAGDAEYYNDYVMGRTPPLILEFNCDGDIYA